jgi:N utilization substance protein B
MLFKVKKSSRRIVREKALQVLFAYEFNKEGLEALIDGVFSDIESNVDKEFGISLINKVLIHSKDFDNLIKTKTANWELKRITLIDLILIKIGICEFSFFPEIPPKVTINESIEIAKEYSTLQSGKFINGILDSILEQLKKSNKLDKKGRGLLDESLQKPKSNDE